MVDVVSSFPLFNLPNNALMHVLRDMGMVEQFTLSILSERAKNLVKNVTPKVSGICVIISETIEVVTSFTKERYMMSCSFYNEEARNQNIGVDEPPMELPVPKSFRVAYFHHSRHNFSDWKKEGYEVKDWLDHLLTVFNYTKIDQISFDSTQFDVKSIHRAFRKVERIRDYTTESAMYSQEIIKNFLPVKYYYVVRNPFESPEGFQKILIQRFDSIELGSFSNYWTFALNDLLSINSSYIEMNCSYANEKDMNQFIKHWMNGSNPRLELLYNSFRNDKRIMETAVLNGLNYQVVPSEQLRIFKLSHGISRLYPYKINGGFDIKRKDGTRATVIIKNYTQSFGFEFYVWTSSSS